MAELISVRLADLLVDAENPRLPTPNQGQREAQRAIAEHQKEKLLALAGDIVAHGLDPSSIPIIAPTNDGRGRYIVLEGNRRLVALKSLENPETISGTLDGKSFDELKALSKAYQDNPIDSILCVAFKNKQDAEHWIELRHTGQNKGAGIVPWNSDEASRFANRAGGLEIHTQALNFLEEQRAITPQRRRQIPATSFKRLLQTPEVRAKCGIERIDGKLMLLADPQRVAKALLHIADDLADGRIATKDIYTQAQRVRYAKKIPAEIVVSPTAPSGKGAPAEGAKAKKTRQSKKPKRENPRECLIPSDCVLKITDARIHEIETELRALGLAWYPNAASVLLRVFVELSADNYLGARSLTPANEKLRAKLECVLNDLLSRNKLTRAQANPVRSALQKNSFLVPSVDLMHDWVHNRHAFPAAGDLRAHWNSLQPFMVAIWSP